MSKSNFEYLTANIYNKKEGTYTFLPNQKKSKIFELDHKVKIGVIGLTTQDTPNKSSGDVRDLEFQNLRSIVLKEAKQLRALGANAVILLNHFGAKCDNEPSMLQLDIRTKDTQQSSCTSDSELALLLKSIGPGVVDAVIGGHTHSINHHWINGVPTIQTDGSSYSNIIYLAFDPLNDYRLIPDLTSIEGPLPSCLKVFSHTKRCHYHTKKDIEESGGQLKQFSFHKRTVVKDTEIDDIVKPWRNIIEEKAKTVIAYNDDVLTYNLFEETTLTNIVTDLCRRVTGAHLGFFSSGGFRTDWYPGDLTEIDLFDMFPFSSLYTTFEMTGEEVIRMVTIMQEEKYLNPTSGIVQRVKQTKDGFFHLIRVALYDGIKEIPIEVNKTYIICTSDFLANGGNFFGKIRKWYDLRNQKKYGQIIDYLRVYLKSIKVIKEKMFIDKDHPRIVIYK